MKLLLLAIFGLVCGAFSSPIHHASNFVNEQRFQLARDEDGRIKLVDLNPIVAEPEPAFDPIQDMFYLLFTRSNPTEPQRISFDLQTITNSNFKRNGNTRILIHGWTTSSAAVENVFTRTELLAHADVNVIVVDWSVGASANYITSRNRVGAAGQAVAQFIDFLNANGYVQHSQIHIIGHSLGSHVAGHVGKNVRNGRINTIFGTDPAGPLFNINNPADRLDTMDADYTEAIHTNAGTLGFDQPITHASFYPNWGSSQPGCGADIGGSCAHARAPLFYSESINSPNFRARQCAGYSDIVARNCPGTGAIGIMGGDSPKSIRGVFFLETNDAAPFARG